MTTKHVGYVKHLDNEGRSVRAMAVADTYDELFKAVKQYRENIAEGEFVYAGEVEEWT